MAVVLTIGGVEKQVQRGTLKISKTANGRSTASFSILTDDADGQPDLDEEVIITEGGTRIFGGVVERPRVRGVAQGARPQIITSVSAVDFSVYAERRYSNGTLTEQTLKGRLQSIITNGLTEYGITLDSGQVDGPTLPTYVSSWQTIAELLNETMKLTAADGEPYTWEIDYFKVLRAYQPSTRSAPFDLVGDTLSQVLGDIEVESDRQRFANRVYVTVGAQLVDHSVSFSGDGSTAAFTIPYVVLRHNGVITTGSGGTEIIGAQWTVSDMQDGLTTVTRTAGVTSNGETYSFRFDGTYTWTMVQDLASVLSIGPIEKVVKLETFPSDTTVEAIAHAELAAALPVHQSVRYRTLETGIEPGMAQTITVPSRGLNLTAMISDVVISEFPGNISGVGVLQRQVTAVIDDSQTNLGRGWRDTYKQWAGDKSGSGSIGAVVAAGTTPLPVQAAPPEKAVQFNRGGGFGGDAAFTYDEDTNCLVCGTDSSITATAPDSCQVFGSHCHIVDP